MEENVQCPERRGEAETLALVRDAARLTKVELEKQIFGTLWKHVRAMWGAPPNHPPAKQAPGMGVAMV